MDILTFLPVEICERILCCLNLKEILNCSLVCRSWYNITNSCNLIWKRFCKQDEVIKNEWNYTVTEWFPCTSEWKMYFLNFKKTIYNWKRNIFKEST
uniref:F-box only protein 16-like protein isoform x3 n=1 Tax=Triatoma infestans TaxID=30076 RepID=A0A171A7M2_TRIIF